MKTVNDGDREQISKQTGTFESFDGTKIYYEVRGHGKPIVLCYGIACLMNHWTHQMRYFSRGYQVITFDYRGHHASPPPKDRTHLTIDAICKDIDGLLKTIGIKKASFWGHSYGAQILLRFYDLFPKAAENLVFINGFSSNPIKGMFGVNAVPVFFHYFKDSYRKYPTAVSAIWRAALLNPLLIPISSLAGGFNLNLTSLKDIEVYARGVAGMDLDVFITFFEQMMAYDGESVLPRIEVPTLVISGSKDGVTPRSHQEKMAKKIPGSQFLNVPYGSHCTQLDLPDFVNLRIEKFLNEIEYTASDDPEPKKPANGARARRRPWDTGSLAD